MKLLKKSITILLVIALACPILAACGDDNDEPTCINTFDDPIEYTAEKPLIDYINYNAYDYISYDKYLLIDLYRFDEFIEYYHENCFGSKLFLLDYGLYGLRVYGSQMYLIYNNNGLIVSEVFSIGYTELEFSPDSPGIVAEHQIQFSSVLMSKPLNGEYTGGELSYEFGNNSAKTPDSKYINISYNGECFATLYFRPYVPITQEWFENYLNDNLIWADTYEN